MTANRGLNRLSFGAVLLLLLGALVFCGCKPSSTIGRSPSKEYAQSSASIPEQIEGCTPSAHFEQRLAERNVTVDQVKDVIRNGQRFYDPKNDSYIRWKDGIYVALTQDNVIKTVIRGPMAKRWEPR
jgi:hypothetical protein